jgi:hypothetical protein
MIIAHSDSVGMGPGGGETTVGTTLKLTTAGAALLPLVVVKAPASKVLAKEPPTAAVTFTASVQPLSAAIELPAGKVTVEPPAIATGTPPRQVVTTFGTAAITTPLGKVSTSGAVRVAGVPLGLVRPRPTRTAWRPSRSACHARSP